jgi:hypothetical protein
MNTFGKKGQGSHRGVIKCDMESNNTSSQIGQNMNIFSQKGHECSKIKHVVKYDI